jgi:hypothetical protein
MRPRVFLKSRQKARKPLMPIPRRAREAGSGMAEKLPAMFEVKERTH